MRTILLRACAFNWAEMSPAIFGELFESVINKVTRHQGVPYTPGDAIFKFIGPLSLDDRQAGFDRIQKLRTEREAAMRATSAGRAHHTR